MATIIGAYLYGSKASRKEVYGNFSPRRRKDTAERGQQEKYSIYRDGDGGRGHGGQQEHWTREEEKTVVMRTDNVAVKGTMETRLKTETGGSMGERGRLAS